MDWLVGGRRNRYAACSQEDSLASDDLIPLEGKVVDVYPGGKFLVETQPEAEGEPMTIQAHLSGKLRRYRIKVVLGDRVTVEVSPYDLKKGRITYRHK